MTIHEKGAKADRDRAVLLRSYEVMVREFRVPKARRISPAEAARMTNSQLLQASKDLYNAQTVKSANRLARKVGKDRAVITEPFVVRIIESLKTWYVVTKAKIHARLLSRKLHREATRA